MPEATPTILVVSRCVWAGLTLIVVGFELWAIFNRAKGDTLSETVWSILSIPGWGKFLTWMIVAFLLWLAAHFATKGKWG